MSAFMQVAAADTALQLTGLTPSKYDNVVPPSVSLGTKATVSEDGRVTVRGWGLVIGGCKRTNGLPCVSHNPKLIVGLLCLGNVDCTRTVLRALISPTLMVFTKTPTFCCRLVLPVFLVRIVWWVTRQA